MIGSAVWKPVEERSRVDSLEPPIAARLKALYDLKVHVRVMPTYAYRVNAIKCNPLSIPTNQKLQTSGGPMLLASYKHV